MNDETRIDDLICLWEIAHWAEQPIEVEDLCHDRPDLIEQVKAIISRKTMLVANQSVPTGSMTDEFLPFAEEVGANQVHGRDGRVKECRPEASPILVAEPIVGRSVVPILLVLLVCSLVAGATGIYWTNQNAGEMEQLAAKQARIAQEQSELAGKNAEEVLERTRERDVARQEGLRWKERDKSQKSLAQENIELKQQNKLLASARDAALKKEAELVQERDRASGKNRNSPKQ